jgi:hypothetical protein
MDDTIYIAQKSIDTPNSTINDIFKIDDDIFPNIYLINMTNNSTPVSMICNIASNNVIHKMDKNHTLLTQGKYMIP